MPPVTVMIKPVSGACNMRCEYCFYADEMKRRGESIYPAMKADMLETLVRRVMTYADGQATFAFQGGEPTLAGIDYFRRLVKLQRQYARPGLQVANALQTNGLHLTDEMIAFFAENDFLLGVSLDGCQATHDLLRKDAAGCGTFDRVLATTRKLDAAGVRYNILCVVNQAVAEQIDAVLEALRPFEFLQFIPCLDPLDGEKNACSLTPEGYGRFLRRAFDYYEASFRAGRSLSIRSFDNWIAMLLGMPPENCALRGACSPGFLVESSGDVYPCDFYALDQWKLGNLRDKSLRQMARADAAEAFCAPSRAVPEKCRACRYYSLCRNGCRRERDGETGLYRFCEPTRAFFDDCGARMSAIAREIQRKQR